MIYIKSQQELAKIRLAANAWKKVKTAIIPFVKPGISTKKLDQIAANEIYKNKCIPSFYQFGGFPGHICISVNQELIHGIGSDYLLKKTDMVTFDIGVTYENYVCDAAFTIVLDKKNIEANKILQASLTCLQKGIQQVKPNNYVGDISYAIEQCAHSFGYEVVKDYGGHGCGLKVHEDPIILNYGKPHSGVKLKPGMVLCIEPMLMIGTNQYIINTINNWTVVSINDKLTCHVEHMVIVNNNGCEILTAD